MTMDFVVAVIDETLNCILLFLNCKRKFMLDNFFEKLPTK